MVLVDVIIIQTKFSKKTDKTAQAREWTMHLAYSKTADAPGPRLESILGHCECHALLHMAPKWFDHWTT